jgi:Icc-related predicted phosphoesterase
VSVNAKNHFGDVFQNFFNKVETLSSVKFDLKTYSVSTFPFLSFFEHVESECPILHVEITDTVHINKIILFFHYCPYQSIILFLHYCPYQPILLNWTLSFFARTTVFRKNGF